MRYIRILPKLSKREVIVPGKMNVQMLSRTQPQEEANKSQTPELFQVKEESGVP
jgi:hypothetical protein